MKPETSACVDGLTMEELARVGEVLKVLAHPCRLKIVEILEGSDGKPVHEIQQGVDLSHAATSQHLNQMRRAGLVASERRGKEVWYRISDERSLTILNCIRSKAERAANG